LNESPADIDPEALPRKPIWTVEDLAAFLSLPVATLYEHRQPVSCGPGYRFGKHLPVQA
jgi:hypothetical protein